jgi:pimeloyl-ACP methyl ester carboxylesterase
MIASRETRTGHGLDLVVHRFSPHAASPNQVRILWLHGFLDAGSTSDLVAEGLTAAGHEVVAPDMRGFGGSDAVSHGGYYHFPNYVADVVSLLRDLQTASHERWVVCGHSMGGTIASLVTGSHPELVSALVLLEGLGPPAMPTSVAVTRMRRWCDQLGDAPDARILADEHDAIARLARHHVRVPREILASRVTHLTRRDAEGQLVWAHDPLHRSTAPTPFDVEAFKSFLAEIRCPVLLIGGGSAGWHPPDESERIAALPHPPEQIDLADAGHMMHWSAAPQTAAAINDFIARHVDVATLAD